LKKYSKGIFRMNRQDGIEVSGEFSPFLRLCIGIGILMLCAAPLIYVIRWW